MTKQESAVALFNKRYGVGQRVLYRKHPHAEPFATTTTSEAFVLGGHTPCVIVGGVSGCVALDALVIVTEGGVPDALHRKTA